MEINEKMMRELRRKFEMEAQKKEIEGINRVLDGFSVLSGTECNIDRDGKPDLPGAVLGDFDIIIGGIHSGFSQSGKEMTRRLINAVHDDNIDIIAHPLARIIGKREPVQADLPAVCDAAADTGVLLEINACRSRLDLTDEGCRTAKDHGVKVSLGTGARSVEELSDMPLGIATARRGWLEPRDVVNTLPEKDLRAFFHR